MLPPRWSMKAGIWEKRANVGNHKPVTNQSHYVHYSEAFYRKSASSLGNYLLSTTYVRNRRICHDEQIQARVADRWSSNTMKEGGHLWREIEFD